MELKEYLKMEIEGLDRQYKRTMDTLTQKEIEWQPACGCNPIGLILLHVFNAEDSFMNPDKTQMLWAKGNWCTKLGLDAKTETAHFKSADEVNCFKVPKLEKIIAYGAAVRKQTLASLKKAKPADFEKMIKLPWGEIPGVMMYSMVVGHATSHLGEMSYIRGIQRGMDK
jgi:hypothetical protein